MGRAPNGLNDRYGDHAVKTMTLVSLRSLNSSLLIFCILISSCRNNERQEASQNSGMGSIVGVNYTENGIQEFFVDGAWGANVSAYSGGGGFVCCAFYPKVWVPGFAVRVKWERSAERHADGSWKIISMERTVPVEKYEIEGNLYVLFFPDDQVKVYVSKVGVGSAKFPSKPGYPEDAKKVRDQ